ncbi:MAG: LLM class F420-dependent oxidoreductase [Microbacteriaceae bacterium]
MQIGVVFPQTEIGAEVANVRAYGLRVEQLGFAHVLAYDHVLGADPTAHAPWTGHYDVQSTFHEPFVLFGYLAAATSLQLATCVVILPQRQTALVAKQAAEVDLLTGGRFRLGVGLGWNPVEYEALGKDFADRGARIDEQIGLLRRLWTQPVVTHAGASERVTAAGLAPLPVQRPIPIWLGGRSGAAYRRIGRLADGWFPQVPLPQAPAALDAIARSAADAGRDPSTIAMDARVTWTASGVDRLVEDVCRWRDLGATHISIDTMKAGLIGVEAHLDALAASADALGLVRAR